MPTSAVSRPRNPPVAAAASRSAAAPLPPTSRAAGRQRAVSSAAAGDSSASAAGTGGPEDGARSRAATSRNVGVERGRLGRVVQQQVRADVQADASTAQLQQQQQPGRQSRSTPATDGGRRSGLPRSSAADKTRARSSNSTTTDVGGRHAAADIDQTPLPRLSTGSADKSEEELEKMRILARHIKVC